MMKQEYLIGLNGKKNNKMTICDRCKEELTDDTQDTFWQYHQTIPDAYNYGDFKIWCVVEEHNDWCEDDGGLAQRGYSSKQIEGRDDV